MKKNIAVLYGGKSSERKISIISGLEVIRKLNKEKYNVFPLEIKNDGVHWQYKSKKFTDYYSFLKKIKVDLVFIALHGHFGEDGTIQGLLESFSVKYTGSKVLASAVAMNKIYSKQVFTHNGLNVPKGIILRKNEDMSKIWKLYKVPIFVKPSNQGSSIGSSKITKKENLKPATREAFKYTNEILIEEYIDGVEITCAILGSDKPRALPLVEIESKNEFFDYKSKYDDKLSTEICPARINKKLTKKAQAAALCAYKAIGCSGFGRVDMIIRHGKIFVLEVNSIPGLTPVSLLPKAAEAVGLSYTKLLDKIIEYS